MFGLPPPAQPADQRSLTAKRRATVEGCRGEAVKNAPRVSSRHPPHHRARLDIPGPVSLSQLDLRPEEHGGAGETDTPWTVPMKC